MSLTRIKTNMQSDQKMKFQTMIWDCNRSQVCGEHLNVFCFLFSRQQRFKSLITVIPKLSWDVWFIPQRQISHTDFSHSLTWSFLKNLPRLWVFYPVRPARGFLFLWSCFSLEFLTERRKTTGFLHEESLSQENKFKKKSNTQKREKGSAFN